MKVTKVTREYFVLEGEKVYFDEPLDHDLTVAEMQQLWEDAHRHINELLEKGKVKYVPEKDKTKTAV